MFIHPSPASPLALLQPAWKTLPAAPWPWKLSVTSASLLRGCTTSVTVAWCHSPTQRSESKLLIFEIIWIFGNNVCSVGTFFSSAPSYGWWRFKRLFPPINVMPGKQRSKFLPPPKIKASSLRQVFWPIGNLLLQIPLEALNVEW